MAKDPLFYQKMLEAKRLKKIAMEQRKLAAEFVETPLTKSPFEAKMDQAFVQLQNKYKTPEQLQKEKLEQAFIDIERKAQGL